MDWVDFMHAPTNSGKLEVMVQNGCGLLGYS